MPVRALVAGIIAAVTTIASSQVAVGADLGGERYGAGSPYDDPRYGAIYGQPPPRVWQNDGEDEDDGDDEDGSGEYGDDRDSEYGEYDGDGPVHGRGWDRTGRHSPYLEPMPNPPRFSESRGRFGDYCLPVWRIKQRLRAGGWRDIEDLSLRDRMAVIRAQRSDTRHVFILKVDRCSGRIVWSRPAPYRAFGSYEPRRHFDRAY